MTTPDVASVDLLALVERHTSVKRVAGTRGGEWAGPCPICRTGRDRFRVQPTGGRDGRGQWMCRSCTDGRWGDAIDFVKSYNAVEFREAVAMLHINLPDEHHDPLIVPPEPCDPPDDVWQARARRVIEAAQRALWSTQDERATRALSWLEKRGLLYRSVV